MEGLYAFLCCLGLSLIPVFLLIYNTVIIKRYYYELEKEKLQPPNMVGSKRRFAIVPTTLDDHNYITGPKHKIIAKNIPENGIGSRNARKVSV